MPLKSLIVPPTPNIPMVPDVLLKFATMEGLTVILPAPLNAVLEKLRPPVCCSGKRNSPPASTNTEPSIVPMFCIDSSLVAAMFSLPPDKFEYSASHDVVFPPFAPLTVTVPALLTMPP